MGQVANKSLELDKKNKRAVLLIILCWLVYTCSYLGKMGYSANIVQFESFYGVSHSQSGTVSTFFFFAYGVGQIINGIFCKKYNIKYFVLASLIVSAVCNLTVGLAPAFNVIKYCWLINGLSLSVLWPTLIRLLSETLSKSQMPKAVVVMGTTVAIGTFLVYGLSALFVQFLHFRVIFYLAGILLPIIALLWALSFNLLTKNKAENEEQNEKIESKRLNKEILISLAVFAFFAVVTNLTKDGLTTWVPSILKELYHTPDSLSILLTLFLPILAVFGTALAVNLYKKIKNFVTLCSLFFVAVAILIGVVVLFQNSGATVTLISFSIISLLTSASNNLITSMLPLYWKDKINSGMIAGVLNGFCYVGSTVSSYGLGAVADVWGWTAVFWLLFGLTCLTFLIGFGYNIVLSLINRRKADKALIN